MTAILGGSRPAHSHQASGPETVRSYLRCHALAGCLPARTQWGGRVSENSCQISGPGRKASKMRVGRISRKLIVGATASLAVLAMVSPAMASSAAPRTSRGAGQAAATFSCDTGYWCVIYHGVVNESKDSVSNWENLGSGGWRNEDDGIWNDMKPGWYLRLWYSPDYKGAHVCIDPGVKIANLAGYVFDESNNTDTGWHHPVKDDVASDTVNQSKCTDPLGS